MEEAAVAEEGGEAEGDPRTFEKGRLRDAVGGEATVWEEEPVPDEDEESPYWRGNNFMSRVTASARTAWESRVSAATLRARKASKGI